MTAPLLDASDTLAVRRFICENTQLVSPPLVPEIRLHLAEESVPLWQKTEDELGDIRLPPPFWAFAWAGGQALARYLLDNPGICRGNTVLDLGSGSGITAIAACLSGAQSVVAADIDLFALTACHLNAAANGVTFEVTSDDQLAKPPAHTTILLIGDLFYERPLAERVGVYIMAAKAQGAVVLVGDPQRSYFPRTSFRRLADYQVPVTRDLEDAVIKNTAVWQA